MGYPLSIKRENEFLASAFGYGEGGIPKFQWRWGADIKMPIVILDDDSKVIYEAHCYCGVGVSIHKPECTWTAMRPKWEVVCLVPDYANQWVITRWVKPEASRDDWESMFGGIPYPAQGYYLPVGDPQKTLAIKPGLTPTREDTILVMMAITEHYSRSAFQRSQDLREKWKQNEAAQEKRYYDACVEAFPVGLKDEFGKTTQWHGQTGVGTSPTESKLIQ